jgi:hypothetical protein
MSQEETKSNRLQKLLKTVADTLEVDPQDGSASFMELGGDSLAAIIVTETLQNEGTCFDVEDLLSTSPLNQIAHLNQEATRLSHD